jgi:hypothetical protein
MPVVARAGSYAFWECHFVVVVMRCEGPSWHGRNRGFVPVRVVRGVQGTSLSQDFRYKDKASKQLADINKHAPPEFKETVRARGRCARGRIYNRSLNHARPQVDMSKVKKDVMAAWVTRAVFKMVGFEDEVLAGLVVNMLDEPVRE